MPDPAVIESVILVALLWVVVERGPAFFHAADELGIGLFKPWRGDPWPRGVQEDDDFRFDWRPRRPVQSVPLDVVVDVDGSFAEPEDIAGASVALERPEHVEVHRAGR